MTITAIKAGGRWSTDSTPKSGTNSNLLRGRGVAVSWGGKPIGLLIVRRLISHRPTGNSLKLGEDSRTKSSGLQKSERVRKLSDGRWTLAIGSRVIFAIFTQHTSHWRDD